MLGEGMAKFADSFGPKDKATPPPEREGIPTPPGMDLSNFFSHLRTMMDRQPQMVDVDYIERFFRLSRGLGDTSRDMQDRARAIRMKQRGLEELTRFHNRGYRPVLEDEDVPVPLTEILELSAGLPADYLEKLASVVEDLGAPKARVSIPWDYHTFLDKIGGKHTHISMGRGERPLTVEEICKQTGVGLWDMLQDLGKFLTMTEFAPAINQYLHRLEEGLAHCMSVGDLATDIIDGSKHLYHQVESYFMTPTSLADEGMRHNGGRLRFYWDVHQDNPLLTVYAINVLGKIPHVKKTAQTDRPRLPTFEKLELQRMIAQLTDPEYFHFIDEYRAAQEEASRNYRIAADFVAHIEDNLRKMLKEAYGIQGKALPHELESERRPGDIARELNLIDLKSIIPYDERKKGLSEKEHKLAALQNEAVAYVISSLAELQKYDSFDERVLRAGEIIDTILDHKDKIAELASGSRAAQEGEDEDIHLRVQGNIISGAYLATSDNEAKTLEEEILASGMSNAVAEIMVRRNAEPHAVMWASYFPKRPQTKPLVILAPRGSGKTTLLEAAGSSSHSFYVDFKDIAFWKYGSVMDNLLNTILNITEQHLQASERPVYLLLDNLLADNPLEESYLFAQQEQQMGESTGTLMITEDDRKRSLGAIIHFMQRVKDYPMLRVIAATDHPDRLFQPIDEKHLIASGDDNYHVLTELARRVDEGLIKAAGQRIEKLSEGHEEMLRSMAKRARESEGDRRRRTEVMNGGHDGIYRVADYFQVLSVRPLSAGEAGKVLQKKLTERLPTDEQIVWEDLFSEYRQGVSGTVVDIVAQRCYERVLDNVMQDATLSARVSDYLRFNGTSPDAWQGVVNILRTADKPNGTAIYVIRPSMIMEEIANAQKVCADEIVNPDRFTQHVATEYHLRPQNLQDGSLVGRDAHE